ncbi:tRNA delta(2)-isopentenylpyrophosphate transferase [sediment metagenome]|uniref:tRNA dimethylallyltransferase n=1 Tax=sediment metagenome TaxID=749907 RepID=D9PF17_9ZZZZ
MFFSSKKKVILINGPTASGKSSLAVGLAKEINGEIISVDSRQIFKEIPIFSGVIKKEDRQNILHYFVEELSLFKGDEFNIVDFKEKVFKIIDDILKRKKIPILVGGSSFFFEVILYKDFLPTVEPDEELRKELEMKTKEELFAEILEKDVKTAERIDKDNKFRLIRAVEIIRENGFVPEIKKVVNKKYDFREIFLEDEKEMINKKIEKNFLERVDGLLEEAGILQSKIPAEKFNQLGLAYKNIFNFWEGNISQNKFITLGIKEEQKYAKRQMTYLNKFYNSLPKSIKKERFLSSDKNLLEKVLNFL